MGGLQAHRHLQISPDPLPEPDAAWPQHRGMALYDHPLEWRGQPGDREPEDLHARINERVEIMFRRGLVEEVKGLLNHGLAENRTALQAIGYRQVVEHLRGQWPLPETIELVKIRTRQFAKRQLTWFRRQLRLEWLTCQGE